MMLERRKGVDERAIRLVDLLDLYDVSMLLYSDKKESCLQ